MGGGSSKFSHASAPAGFMTGRKPSRSSPNSPALPPAPVNFNIPLEFPAVLDRWSPSQVACWLHALPYTTGADWLHEHMEPMRGVSGRILQQLGDQDLVELGMTVRLQRAMFLDFRYELEQQLHERRTGTSLDSSPVTSTTPPRPHSAAAAGGPLTPSPPTPPPPLASRPVISVASTPVAPSLPDVASTSSGSGGGSVSLALVTKGQSAEATRREVAAVVHNSNNSKVTAVMAGAVELVTDMVDGAGVAGMVGSVVGQVMDFAGVALPWPGSIAADLVLKIGNMALTAMYNMKSCKKLADRATDILQLAVEHSELMANESHYRRFMSGFNAKLEEILDFVSSFSSKGWMSRIVGSASDKSAFQGLWGDLSTVVGDMTLHVSVSTRASMETKMSAKSGEFEDESAALRAKLDELGGPEALNDPEKLAELKKCLSAGDKVLMAQMEAEMVMLQEMRDEGPHSIIRHDDMRVFWRSCFKHTEKVEWTIFWGYLKRAPPSIEDVAVLKELAADQKYCQAVQAAVSRIDAKIVTTIELDDAFPEDAALVAVLQQLAAQVHAGDGASTSGSTSGADAAPAAICALPPEESLFVGREEDVAALRAHLALPEVTLVSLVGAPGTGKSATAASVVRGMWDECSFGSVLHVDMRGATSHAEAVRLLVGAAGLSEEEMATVDGVAFYTWISQHMGCGEGEVGRAPGILVMDNAESLMTQSSNGPALSEVVTKFIKAAPGIKVLLTSRVAPPPSSLVSRQHDLRALPLSAAVELLARLLPEGVGQAGMERLAGACACNPLALRLLGSSAASGAMTVEELLEESAEGKSFFEMAGGEGAAPLQAAVASTLAVLSKPQRAFLLLLAIFPGAFDVESAAALTDTDTRQARSILRQLRTNCLVESTAASSYSLQPMVAEALRSEIATQSGPVEAAKERLAGHCAGVVLQAGRLYKSSPLSGCRLLQRLRTVLEAVLGWVASGGWVKGGQLLLPALAEAQAALVGGARVVGVEAATRALIPLLTEPLELGRAHAVVACCTLTRGDYAATIGAAVSACTVLGAMGGSEADLARANALSLQADALWLKGDNSAALALLTEAQSLHSRHLEKTHPDGVLSHYKRGVVLAESCRYKEAAEALRAAKEAALAGVMAEHTLVTQIEVQMRLLTRDQEGDSGEEEAYRAVLAATEKAHGNAHPDTSAALNCLGNCLHDKLRFAEAEDCYRRAMAALEASVGADHPDMAICLNNVGMVLQNTGRREEAHVLFEKSAKMRETQLGSDHIEFGRTLNCVGTNLHSYGRLDEAEAIYRQSLAVKIACLGEENLDSGFSYNLVGMVLHSKKKYQEAVEMYQRALAIFEENLGPEDPTLGSGLAMLAAAQTSLGEYAEAAKTKQRAAVIQEKVMAKQKSKDDSISKLREAADAIESGVAGGAVGGEEELGGLLRVRGQFFNWIVVAELFSSNIDEEGGGGASRGKGLTKWKAMLKG